MSSSETEAETKTVESSSEGYEMRNSLVGNQATQRESINVHPESQSMSSMKVSNNGFTNMGRIRSGKENVM